MTKSRRTLAAPVTVEGIGIHTGIEGFVKISPAPSGAGVVFRTEAGEIPATPASVVDTSRCTVLGNGQGATVSTVEHLLSAFFGLGISDAYVDITGPELPIGDGGAILWTDALTSVGLTEGEPLAVASLVAPQLVTGRGGAFLAAYPSDKLSVTVAISFDHPMVGTQIARYVAGDDYVTEVAPARTFGFIEEVEALRKAGLALGGSEENAVVVYQDHYSRPLHFENELARHKLLDVLGDLYLAFGPALPPLEIFAVKPSHRLNTELATRLTAV